MQFGTKIKLKKDWQYNQYFLFEKGDEFQVAQYHHKYGMKLHYQRISDLLDFEFNWMTRDSKIEEYFEVVEQFDDRLAELEKVILDYYLAKGYKILKNQSEVDNKWWFFTKIYSLYKQKLLTVTFCEFKEKAEVFAFEGKTTKEMFDKAFEYFSIKV